MLGLTLDQYVYLLRGTGWTLVLSAIGFVLGAMVGFPLALARISRNRLVSRLAATLIQIKQGIPLPVLMFLVYFGLGLGGFEVPALVAAGFALSIYAGAYLGEIWRGCIAAVPREQWEAAECLALTKSQRLFYVILPQSVRLAIPPTVGFLVQIVKDTSNAVVIGFFDLTYSAKVLNNSTFKPFFIFTLVALIYFAMCYPLTLIAGAAEARLANRRAGPLRRKGLLRFWMGSAIHDGAR
ncbi:ABC transporter permease subunit [Paraburkholderia sp. 1N]|uniref:ABC transporter permease subunit n=1 Tax=Paraburkholderia solitsugae TaxID=2675748 RepID=A0ABX2BUJ4_9BURK|nr:amino acid ABC transporter permease [Paraburkholderia solitsugae]NPT43485.1 ABC transporter permease subunit [Paraburkholderia solitsugae]